MAPIPNGRIVFNEIPTGFPIPGRTTRYDESEVIDPDTVPLAGGFLLKVLILSVDPYMRERMQGPEVKSYMPMYAIGETLANRGVARVVRSEDPEVQTGDHVIAFLPFQQYVIRPNMSGCLKLENPWKLPWSVYVGAAGMAGKTAYMGWRHYAQAKAGNTVFVTTAAGAVGSLVIQLAKRDGLRVIASAGSDEKVDFVRTLGADIAFNYKTTDTRKVLAEAGPIDIYWDNVGGATLEAALDAAAIGARIIECGMISGYNNPDARPVRNLHQVYAKGLALHGFIVFRLEAAHPSYTKEFADFVLPRLARGEILYREDVTRGLERAGDAILAVQAGTNNGKSIVLVSE